MTMTVAYRGNGACFIEVKARGRTWYADGHLCFLDVLTEIWNADEDR